MNDWEWNRTLAFIAACDLDNEVCQRIRRDDLVKSQIKATDLHVEDFVLDWATGRFVKLTEVEVLEHYVRFTDTAGTPLRAQIDEMVTVAR